MCLITKQKEPIILTEDLRVYKVLGPACNNSAGTVYFEKRFVYEFGKLYRTKISESFKHTVFDIKVCEQYNLYLYGADLHLSNSAYGVKDKMRTYGLTAYGQGFHFITTKTRVQSQIHSKLLYECVIPAGAEVYYDETGLGVTNQITVIGTAN